MQQHSFKNSWISKAFVNKKHKSNSNELHHVLYSDTCKRTKSRKPKVKHIRFCIIWVFSWRHQIVQHIISAPMVFVREFPYLQLKRFISFYLSYLPISLTVKGMVTCWGTYSGLSELFYQVHYFMVPVAQNQVFQLPQFTTSLLPRGSNETHFFIISFIICLLKYFHFMNFLGYSLSSHFKNPKVSLPSLKDVFFISFITI